MKTASFFTFTGPGRISIARIAPRNTAPGYKIYKPLAPGRWFESVTYDRYRELYIAQLAELDAASVVAELTEMAAGAEPILLCWEKPPFDARNWCHRILVSEWLSSELGLVVPELEPGRNP